MVNTTRSAIPTPLPVRQLIDVLAVHVVVWQMVACTTIVGDVSVLCRLIPFMVMLADPDGAAFAGTAAVT